MGLLGGLGWLGNQCTLVPGHGGEVVSVGVGEQRTLVLASGWVSRLTRASAVGLAGVWQAQVVVVRVGRLACSV